MTGFRKQKQYLKRKKVCTQIEGKKIMTLRQKPKDSKHKSNQIKPKSKPTQPKYPKLTHISQFITKKEKEKKKQGKFFENKNSI